MANKLANAASAKSNGGKCMTRRFGQVGLALWLAVLLAGCNTIALFDQVAYLQATSLKVDALTLMEKATERYRGHAQGVTELMVRVDKAYEYDRGRPKNEISAKLWEKLKDPNGHLLGGFMNRWKTSEQLGEAFVTEAKGLVGDAFDTIIQLESGKIRPTDVK